MNLQHPSYNSQGGIVTPQQLQQQQQQMASMQHQQQSQGMTQHGHIQGQQRVFIPGMGTMIMSTTTGPDGESIGHLSFPSGSIPGGGTSNEAPPAMFNTMAPSQQQQTQLRFVNSSSQGNLSNNGAGLYQSTVIPNDEMLIPPGISSSDTGPYNVSHNISQQQNIITTPQKNLYQGIINSDLQNSPPSLSVEDATKEVVAQSHNIGSPNVSYVGILQQSKQIAADQIVLPIYGYNNKLATGGVSAQTESMGTPNIVYNVKFKRTQRSFILGPRAPRDIKVGCFVKVEADRGEDLGVVISRVPAEKYNTLGNSSACNSRPGIRGGSTSTSEPPTAGASAVSFGATDLKKVVRLATDEEISLLEDKRLEEEALLKICRVKVKQRGLNMNVVDAEYQFDRHKLIFFFEAEGRVDFRELVRDLFSIYKTRIWMQQLDKAGGSGVNNVGVCTGIGEDGFEEDLMLCDDGALPTNMHSSSYPVE